MTRHPKVLEALLGHNFHIILDEYGEPIFYTQEGFKPPMIEREDTWFFSSFMTRDGQMIFVRLCER